MSADTQTGVTPVLRRWQIGLVVLGLALLAVGVAVLFSDVKPDEVLGLAVWFAGAIILHDGVIAFGVFGVQLVLRRTGRRVPLAVLAILQGAVVVGSIVALIVIPQIYKSAIGANNPTVVPLDYAANLAWFYLGMAVVTAIVIAVYLRVSSVRGAPRRQKLRPSTTQD